MGYLFPFFFVPLYRTSKSFVKKKAALTLLRLFRKHPDVIPVTDWAERIISLMDDYDLVNNRSKVRRLCVCVCVLTYHFRALHLVSPRWFLL